MSRIKVGVKFISPGLIKDGERTTNRHHRRARSNGGTRSRKNMSSVMVAVHNAFHYFFNHKNGKVMNAVAIASVLEVLYPMIVAFFTKQSEEGGPPVLKTKDEILNELNSVWIDPSYVLEDQTPAEGISTLNKRNFG